MFKNIWNEFRATQQSLDEKKKTEAADDDTVRMMKDNPKMQKTGGPGGMKGLNKKAQKDVKTALKNDNTNDKEDDGDGMDKVQPKALKKKFKDRKDKDIDNDGDVDSSDEYLHNRRKTVSKKVDENDDEKKKKKVIGKEKDGDVEVNPKMDKGGMKESIRDRLMSVLGEDAAKNRNPNAEKAEKPEDKLKGKGAKDMMDQPTEKDDTVEKGHDDASKAGKVTKPAAARNGSDAVRSGDQGVRNPIKKTMEAYMQVQELSPGKLGAYVKGAEKDKIKKYAQSDMGKVSKSDALKNQQKRNKGIDMAKSKMKPAKVPGK